jgi:hypothetical protein
MSVGRFRFILVWLATATLVVGLTAAAWTWHAQDLLDRQESTGEPTALDPLAPLDSRKHVREVEIYYGKLGVLLEESKDLLHGKPLAKGVAFLAIAVSAGLFIVAARLAREIKT